MGYPSITKRKSLVSWDARQSTDVAAVRAALIEARKPWGDNNVVDVLYYAHMTGCTVEAAIAWRLRQPEVEAPR